VSTEDSSLKKVVMLKEKLISSDTGRTKQRLTHREKDKLFTELGTLLQKSDKSSMISYIYANE